MNLLTAGRKLSTSVIIRKASAARNRGLLRETKTALFTLDQLEGSLFAEIGNVVITAIVAKANRAKAEAKEAFSPDFFLSSGVFLPTSALRELAHLYPLASQNPRAILGSLV